MTFNKRISLLALTILMTALAVALTAVLIFGIGGKETVASRSAAAFREAQRKGEPVGESVHGHGAFSPGAPAQPAHGEHRGPEMKESGHAQQKSSAMAGHDMSGQPMSISSPSADAHARHAMSAQGGPGRSPAGREGQPQKPAGGHAGMQHGSGPAPQAASPLGSAVGSTTRTESHEGMRHDQANTSASALAIAARQAEAAPGQPAATLRPDPHDQPAETSIVDARRSVEMAREMGGGHGMQHGTTSYRQPWRMENGFKTFHLVAEPVVREFAPGLKVNCWGYNGTSPGPTIEAVEGDRLRIYVENRLPEPTSVHWHGVLLPNGMDGVAGLNQRRIEPGETFKYEFTVRQHGTQMYHPHFDEMVQQSMGMMGFLIFHPRRLRCRVDRDYAIFLNEWFIKPGTSTPDPTMMLDFNVFTFNSRVFPGTEPLLARLGDRVRVRIANISMDSHPIHLHGHTFRWTASDGGPLPESAWIPETSINVPPGTTRDIEFIADNPGDWALHCHKVHHTMNQIGHNLPILTGVDTSGVEQKLQGLIPGYMTMGTTGMGDMMDMGKPRNTLPMGGGEGPFGTIFMGGMFTILKIRENLRSDGADPGWYRHPAGTVAAPIGKRQAAGNTAPGIASPGGAASPLSSLAVAAAAGPLQAVKANACGAPPRGR